MRGMLVAAGFGTRLSPLTRELPKPAVPVANRPLAAFAMGHLCAAGVSDLVVNTHHLAVALERALSPHLAAAAQLRFVHEPRILGTGGGVKHAWSPPHDEPFVVMNAKLLFAPDIAHLLAVHRSSGALATLVLKRMPAGARFGPVDIDGEGRVRALLAPSLADGRERCMFTGVYVLHPRAHASLPDEGCVVRQGFIPWLAAGERLMGVVEATPFADLGQSLAHYHAGNMDLLTGRRSWPEIRPERETQTIVDPSARIHPDARLSASVIGPDARVGPVTVARSVIWAGARVERDLDGMIVMSTGQHVSVPTTT